jgi:hypothetical protein
MTDRPPTETTNIDGYGFVELPWSRPHDILAAGNPGRDTPWFLGTIRPDGTPHAAGIGANWYDGLAGDSG